MRTVGACQVTAIRIQSFDRPEVPHLVGYLILVAVVVGVNLLPAFGPPTWAVLVFFRLNEHLAVIPLILLGAVAAAVGRTLLAMTFSRLRGRIPDKYTANLTAAGKVLTTNRKRSITGLALFALSPLPSAQLFERRGSSAWVSPGSPSHSSPVD